MSNAADSPARTGLIIIEHEIEGVDALLIYQQARASFISKGATTEECEAWLGTPAEPKLEACAKEILQPKSPPEQMSTLSTKASYFPDDIPMLRKSVIVHASTGNITKRELAEIDSLFDAEIKNGERKCFEHIRHGPLFMSPKDYGFYARIPQPDPKDPEQWNGLTPEMRALVDAAIRQGASTIEFDADEDCLEGFYDQSES